jgi:hypothetical protein
MFARVGRLTKISIAGGGFHGAFTWGVLDRLLEEPLLRIAAISGTSAGAVALTQLYGRKTGVELTRLGEVARVVAAAAARPIPVNKAIVGDHVFTHESGIHVDGLLKDRRTYQALDPAVLGRSHRFVIGKHSGLAWKLG